MKMTMVLAATIALALAVGSDPTGKHDVGPEGLAEVISDPQRFRGGSLEPEGEPLARSEWEKRILEVIRDLEGQRGFANVPRRDGRLLRLLVEAVGAKTVVEIGTSNGYSGLWICMALKATGGHLVTHEINPERVRLARANFERAGVSELVTIVQGDAHETVKRLKGPIDVVFIDADKSGYLDYLRKLLPLVRKGGLILAHNVNYPSPGPEFMRAITTDPQLETLFLHMDGPGMSVSLKKR